MERVNLTEAYSKGKGYQVRYAVDCIKEAMDLENEPTDKEAVEYFLKDFDRVANYPYNKKRFPNTAKRICDYLQGLPNTFCVEYRNYKIIEIGKSWGFCQTEKKEEKFVENWFTMLGVRVLQAASKLGIDLSKYI